MANKDGDLIPIVRCFDGGFMQLALAAAARPVRQAASCGSSSRVLRAASLPPGPGGR